MMDTIALGYNSKCNACRHMALNLCSVDHLSVEAFTARGYDGVITSFLVRHAHTHSRITHCQDENGTVVEYVCQTCFETPSKPQRMQWMIDPPPGFVF
jgi:hypothetical protein